MTLYYGKIGQGFLCGLGWNNTRHSLALYVGRWYVALGKFPPRAQQ